MSTLKSTSLFLRVIIIFALFEKIILAGDLNSIDEISVNKIISNPKSAHFLGLGTVLGPGLVELKDRKRDEALTEICIKNDIDIAKIIYTALLAEFRNTTFNSILKDEAKFQVIIDVTDYGLAKGWGFGNNMKPFIKTKIKIIDPNNNKLWGNTAYVDGSTKATPIKHATEWFNNPDLLKSAYQNAANILAKSLLKKFLTTQPTQSIVPAENEIPSEPQQTNSEPLALPPVE